MVDFPQSGGCLCGALRYRITGDPLTCYACHCTDCQTETGSAFFLSLVVRSDALEIESGEPEPFSVELADGRVKGGYRCPRCAVRLWGEPSQPGIRGIEAGTLDDTSWIDPVGHIWARSAQRWIHIPEDALVYEQQPGDEDWIEMVRRWKQRGR